MSDSISQKEIPLNERDFPVHYCPYCGGSGASGTRNDFIIGKIITEFWCDDCGLHSTIIHHISTSKDTAESDTLRSKEN